EEAVEMIAADDVQRRRGNVLPLLVAGGNHAGADVDADVGLTETVAEDGGVSSIGGYAQDAAIVFAERRVLLAAFRDHELAVRREADLRGELAVVGGLGEGVREEFVDVG